MSGPFRAKSRVTAVVDAQDQMQLQVRRGPRTLHRPLEEHTLKPTPDMRC